MDKYSYTEGGFKEKISNFFKNNKKIIIVATSVIIVILLMFLIIKNYNNSGGITNSKNGLSINLLGSNVITISKNENFLDPGYIAIDKDEGNLTNEVQITGIIDTTKSGTYTRYYTVINKDGTIVETTRTIVVKDATNTSNLTITLKGNSTISLKLNEKYVEPGYTAQDKSGDLTKSVQVTGTVDTSKEGTYTLKYKVTNSEGQTKEVKRSIVVLPTGNNNPTEANVTASINVSATSYTKNPVMITVKVEGTGYQHTILPDGRKTYNTVINYSVSNNNTYNFYVYDTNGHVQILTQTVNNIDRTAPTGICTGKIEKNTTILQVTQASDDLSGVADYLFKSGTTSYRTSANSYTLSFATKTASVSISDKVGNYREVNCYIEGELPTATLPVVLPASSEKVKYKAISESLVLHISYQNGYYLTRIWAKDPVHQMRKQLTTVNSSLKPKEILGKAISKYNLKDKIVVGSNASPCINKGGAYNANAVESPIYNYKEPSSLLIYNGKVIINDYEKYTVDSTVIYYLDGNHQLKYIKRYLNNKTVEERKKIFTDVINSGAYNTYAFNKVLVEDYKVAPNIGNDYNAKRQGFCQIDKNNFILVSSDTKTWPRPKFAKFLVSIGCKTAVNFDGGGSTSLLYKKSGTTTISTLASSDRGFCSYMYFTEIGDYE